MLTLYARKTPCGGVVLYKDETGREEKARFQWWNRDKPDYRNRYVMLNCYRWNLVWLEPAKEPIC